MKRVILALVGLTAVVLFWHMVWPSLIFLLALVLGAFFWLLFSPQKYEQKPVDIASLHIGDVVLFGSNKNITAFPIKIANVLTSGIGYKYWTHATVYVGGGKLVEATSEGVNENTVQHYLDAGRIAVVCRHRFITDPGFMLKVSDFCYKTAEDKYKYSWAGLVFYALSITMPRNWDWFIFDNKLIDKWLDLDHAYFCSEFVADAFKQTGAPVSEFDSWRVKPADFLTSPLFRQVV